MLQHLGEYSVLQATALGLIVLYFPTVVSLLNKQAIIMASPESAHGGSKANWSEFSFLTSFICLRLLAITGECVPAVAVAVSTFLPKSCAEARIPAWIFT